jgi:co-chaperonin GroES (HSP10)
MREKLLTKTRLGAFEAAEWTGENLSGELPVGDRVLVLPDKAATKTAGGIELPSSMRETQTLAAESGVIVAIGLGAWTWNADRTRRFEGIKPQVGQRVSFERYSGTEIIGADGEIYRAMSDASIATIKQMPAAATKDKAA